MTYYRLTKPGIIRGNALSAAAGFCLAASLQGSFDFKLFVAMLVGSSLVIACGCVINNYIDRNIDALMKRTSKRALVTAQISLQRAIAFGVLLGILGFAILIWLTNPLTTAIGAVGLFFYLVMYSIYKRRSPIGTVIGSVSGATPITAGYTAVTSHFDAAALILFLSMVTWQMPHFYAIAMYRLKDYQAAKIPVLPAKKGMRTTKLYILAYTAAFTVASVLLTVFGYTGYIYAVLMALLGLFWFGKGIRGFTVKNDEQWGKSMFLFSLIALLAFCLLVAVGGLLP